MYLDQTISNYIIFLETCARSVSGDGNITCCIFGNTQEVEPNGGGGGTEEEKLYFLARSGGWGAYSFFWQGLRASHFGAFLAPKSDLSFLQKSPIVH